MQLRTDFSEHKFRSTQMSKLMPSQRVYGLTLKQEELFLTFHKRYMGEGRRLTENQLGVFHDLGLKKHKKPELSKTAETELKKIHTSILFKRTKEIQSMMTEKGTMVEEHSITLDSEVTGELRMKNKERRENEYWTGECDNVTNIIRDYKSSFDFETFSVADLRKEYECQGNVYMVLWDKDECEIIYCLVDTPNKIVNDLLRKMDWKIGIFDSMGSVREKAIPVVVELVSNHIYTEEGLKNFCEYNLDIQIEWFDGFVEIAPELRRKVYHFKRDEKLIETMKTQVELGRKYLNKLSEEMADRLNVLIEVA